MSTQLVNYLGTPKQCPIKKSTLYHFEINFLLKCHFYYRLGSLKEIFNDDKLDLAFFRSRLRQRYWFDRTLHGKKLQVINFQYIQYTISLLVKCTLKTFDKFQCFALLTEINKTGIKSVTTYLK